MRKEMREIWRRWRALPLAVVMAASASVDAAQADDCLDDETEGAVGGGVIGAAGGGLVAAAVSGATLAVTAGATAAAGATVAITMTADCGLTLCIPILTGLTGLGMAIGYLFWADSDCAGAIAFGNRDMLFYRVRDRDSNEEAVADAKGYCESSTDQACTVVAPFRHCAAIAQDLNGRVFGFGTARISDRANNRALEGCRDNGGSSCRITLSARCNSG